jgi:hypothetical protein
MVSVHSVWEVARFSTRQCVSQEAFRLESKSIVIDGSCVSIERDQAGVKGVRTHPDTSPRCDGFRSS